MGEKDAETLTFSRIQKKKKDKNKITSSVGVDGICRFLMFTISAEGNS